MPGTSSTTTEERFPAEAVALADVQRLMRDAGAQRLYIKELAWNHDSKRQIYLTKDLSAFNVFPNRLEYDPPMPSWIDATDKPIKGKDQNRLHGHLDFCWLLMDGQKSQASHAKIIYYPQYPEVRLSGFLKGARRIPSQYLRAKSGEVYLNRLLFLGVTDSRQVVGFLAVGQQSLRDELRQTAGYDVEAALNTIPLFGAQQSPRERLLTELTAIHRRGWLAGKRIKNGEEVPYTAPNAIGYTLEAALGISPNGDNAPDFMGWEVKAHTVTSFTSTENRAITLFTPEPDLGVYVDSGVVEFMRRWGYDAVSGETDRRNFGGTYRAGQRHGRTGLRLEIRGYQPEGDGRIDPAGYLALVSDEGAVAAGWSFGKLIECWQRKHAAAVYVAAVRRKALVGYEFQYADQALLCEGTDILRFLEAVSNGVLYLDPALKALNWSQGNATVKRRNQFRIKMNDVNCLYVTSQSVGLCS